MKIITKNTLILFALLYVPFIVIVRDPFSPWWHYLALPGWPVQLIHSNNTFALTGGLICSLILITVFRLHLSQSSKRFYLTSIAVLSYSIASSLFIQWVIHAG